MFDVRLTKQTVTIAVPILISSIAVLVSVITNATTVSHANVSNWYILTCYLPISHLILGLLESGRVCCITGIGKHSKLYPIKHCTVLSAYYSLPFLLISLLLMVMATVKLNPFNVSTIHYDTFTKFAALYSLSYSIVSANSICNAALFALGNSVLACMSIVITSLLAILFTHIIFYQFEMGIYAIIVGNAIAYTLGLIVSIIMILLTTQQKDDVGYAYWERGYQLCRTIGLPIVLIYIALPIGIYLVIHYLSAINQDALTGFGIAYRIQSIILLPAVALGIAAGINSNRSHHATEKYHIITHTVILTCIVYIPIVTTTLLLSDQISQLLTQDKHIQTVIHDYFHYVSWSYLLYCPLVSVISILEQTGFAIKSLLLNIAFLLAQIGLAMYVATYHYSIIDFSRLLTVIMSMVSIVFITMILLNHHGSKKQYGKWIYD